MSPTSQLLSWGRLAVAVFFVGALSAAANDQKPASKPVSKAAPADEIAQYIANLGAADFPAREEAVAGLIRSGRPAIAPLAAAVLSRDPEIAWRAATALEAIGLQGDEATLTEIKTRVENLKSIPHRDLALVLGSLTQRWNEMQRVKAQNALVKMGATFPTSTAPGMPGGPVVMSGGVVYSGSYAMPVFRSTAIIPGSFPGLTTPAAPTATIEFDPLAIPSSIRPLIEEVEKMERSEEAVEEDAPKDATEKDAKESDAKESDVKEADAKESDAKESDAAEEAEKSTETTDETAPEVIREEVIEALVAPTGPFEMSFSTLDLAASAAGTPFVGLTNSIRLDENWTGGDRGLAYLAALPHINMLDIQNAPLTDKAIAYLAKLPSLTAIQVRGSKMTPAALLKLAKSRSGLSVRGQSRGVLGINSGAESEPCVVTAVSPGAPAHEAGIAPGDLLTHIDGAKIETFGHLTLLMKDKEPGDEVKIALKRGEKTLEKSFRLGNRAEILR